MTVPDTIKKLVETFALHKGHYKSSGYNETELRREFLDPFFKALGWDVDNEAGYADAYKDVIHEDAIKVGGDTKAPDYCFRIGGVRKYFVEAKKPSVDIRDAIAPAFQLRRYGWSAKLPLSILTDFEEFAVYDTRIRPGNNDKTSTARTLFVTFDQYVERWDEIHEIFARESVLRGSFDQYAETTKIKRGTGTVDDAFLEEIERWREVLAKNIALRNGDLSVRDLNYSVQKIIDRIIFLRICEDRGTEDYKRLRTVFNGERTYKRLLELFYRADDRYNSGLFHFDDGDASRSTPPDNLTPNLIIDDKVLKDILKNLYYPESPYEFSVLPADILGQVYERFLGKTIRLTTGHQAKIEEKPEVRKAGGVYYTPDYIVEYIVRNTLGRMLDGDNPDQPNPVALSKAAEIKVLDPACGSGSFLLVAYQYLLDWHLRQYSIDSATALPDEKKIKRYAGGREPRIYQGAGGMWRLTTAERKRILLNNIHGVDIDSQAVEVTKLSLLLKVLEGETQQQLQRDFIKERQRILPDLGRNIQCGNSLIGPDFYDNEQMSLLDDDTHYRINVFDWNAGFPEIMKRGGFDCVIGNPPYIRIQAMKEWAPVEVDWYKHAYRSASAGNYDIYVVFVEKGLSLLGPSGRLGFILPHKFFNAKYGASLRGLIGEGRHLAHVVHFGDQQIFTGATTYTCLMFLDKSGADACWYVNVHDIVAWRLNQMRVEDDVVEEVGRIKEAAALYSVRHQKRDHMATSGKIPAKLIGADDWNFVVGKVGRVLERLHKKGDSKLGDLCEIFVGLQTSADKIYVISKQKEIEAGLTKPFLQTGNLHRYTKPQPSARLIFPYRFVSGKIKLLDSGEVSGLYPMGWAYLLDHKSALSNRNHGAMRHDRWYAYVYPKNLVKFHEPKLVIQVTAKRPTVMLDESGLYMTGGGSGPFYGIRPKSGSISLKYLLGVMNSGLFGVLVKAQSTNLRGGYIKFSKQYIESVPIRPIDFDKSADVALHDRMVTLVDRMLDLHRKKASERNPNILKQLETQINVTDRQIDQLVYEVYGLTEEDIVLVEDAACRD